MFQAKVVEEIETSILYSIPPFFFSKKKNSAFCKIMWENTVDPSRPQTILRMRIARCVTKATNAHSKCVILFAFPRQQFLSVTLYVNCFSCFIWYMNVLVLYIYTQFDVRSLVFFYIRSRLFNETFVS